MACCVKDCKSRRELDHQNGTAKKSFFTVRTNDISWYNILSNKNIKINKNSRICELHFKPEDIIKEDSFTQADGTVIYLKRKNPKLKEGAVPSIFPQKNKCYQQIEHKYNDNVMSCEFSTEYETSGILHSAEESIFSTSHETNNALQIEDRSFVQKKEIKFSAEDITIAKNIEVPTCYWFANINDSYMMWTCWANDLSYILRRVIVQPNMKVQVFIGDKEIFFDTKMIHHIREIKQILIKLQNFFPCEKVNDKNRVTNCHGFVIKRQYKVKEKMRCLPCKKNFKMYVCVYVIKKEI